jgi:hypothetical protein
MRFPEDWLFSLPRLFYLLIPETRRDELRLGSGVSVSKNPSVLDKVGCSNEFRARRMSGTQQVARSVSYVLIYDLFNAVISISDYVTSIDITIS